MYAPFIKKNSTASLIQKKKAHDQHNIVLPADIERIHSNPVSSVFPNGQTISKLSMAASPQMITASNVLQKQVITQEQALETLEKRGLAFKDQSEILQLWDTDWEESNCHGYTQYNTPGHAIDGNTFLLNLSEYSSLSKQSISLFFNGNALYHSGRYSDGILTHLLMGIGILQTRSNRTETFGYDQRFNLPKDREAFYDFISSTLIRIHLLERVSRVTDTFHNDTEWLEFFHYNKTNKKTAFDHVYDIKDELDDESEDLIILEEDILYIDMEDYVRAKFL